MRHAESTWNRATARGDVATMLTQTDHPLSRAGAAQAVALREALDAASRSTGDALERAFLASKLLIASPSRRTAQTALAALRDHPAAAEAGVVLRSDWREVRGVGRDNLASADLRGNRTPRCLHS